MSVMVRGVIPESTDVLSHSNMGQPVILGDCPAADCYEDMVQRCGVARVCCGLTVWCYRFLGEERSFRHLEHKPKGLFSRLFS